MGYALPLHHRSACRYPPWLTLVLAVGCMLPFSVRAEAAQAAVPSVCEYVVKLANSNQLKSGAMKGISLDDPTPASPDSFFGVIKFKDVLDINNDGIPEHVFVTYSQNGGDSLNIYDAKSTFVGYKIDKSEEESFVESGTIRLIRYDNAVYVVSVDDEAGYGNVGVIDAKNLLHSVCELGLTPHSGVARKRMYRTLSGYEKLIRRASLNNKKPWEYALSGTTLESAELLIRNGHKVNDEIYPDMPLLMWAVWQHRDTLVDWLLKHGANPNINSGAGTPLQEALWRGSGPSVVIRLLEHGANPTKYLTNLQDYVGQYPLAGKQIQSLAIDRLGYVPEEFVVHAIEHDKGSVDDFLNRNIPAGFQQREWKDGRVGDMPDGVFRALANASDPQLDEKIRRLYSREVKIQDEKRLYARYGSTARRWVMLYTREANVSPDDFLLLATSFCAHFLPANCGPDELISRARLWEKTLRYKCPTALSGVLDATACNVVVRYANTKGFDIYPFISNSKQSQPAIHSVEEIKHLYLEKSTR